MPSYYSDDVHLPLVQEVPYTRTHKRTRSYSSTPSRRLRLLILPVLIFVSLFFLLIPSKYTPSVLQFPTQYSKADDRETAERIRAFIPLLERWYPPARGFQARQHNFDNLATLAASLEAGNCTDGQRKVVLFGSFNFGFAQMGYVSGENIWAGSMIRTFDSLNYTLLYGFGVADTLFIYRHLGDLIPIVIWEGMVLDKCMSRNATSYATLEAAEHPSPVHGTWQTATNLTESDTGLPPGEPIECMYSPTYPQGVPWYKSFVFHFWGGCKSPWLGGQWTLSPETYEWDQVDPQHGHSQYIGYSIAERCKASPFFEDREHRALVLGKRPVYFKEANNAFYGQLAAAGAEVPPLPPSEPDLESDDSKATNDSMSTGAFQIISTAGNAGEALPEPGVTTLGKMKQEEWLETLARSKVLLGIGSPKLSPSPFDALCVGVPFVNPVLLWDKRDPENRQKWVTQNQALRMVEEPWVYHVHKGDKDGLASALARAAATPIPRKILPNMQPEALLDRHRALVETDWKERARERIVEKYGDAEEWAYLAMP